jgi:hypothetical protein
MKCRVFVAAALVVFTNAVCLKTGAAADGFCKNREPSQGAVQASLRPGQLGVARPVCAANQVGLGQSGLLVLDLDNFFGSIKTATELQGEYRLSETTSVFGLLEAYRYEAVIASVAAVESGVGHSALGINHRYLDKQDLAVAFATRLVLPVPFGLSHHVSSVALDVATGFEWAVLPRLRTHGTVGLISSVGIASDASQPRLGTQWTLGAGWQAFRSFAVVADVVSGFGYAGPVDLVAAATSLRYSSAHLTLSLDALVPLGGRERSLAAAALRLAWNF